MTKEKRYNLWAILATLVIAGIIYLTIEVLCNLYSGCYYTYQNLIPFVFIFLGFSASSLLLLIFKVKIFISWLKYIAWWYLILTAWITSLPNNDPWYDNGAYAIILMTTLFIITLIYALVMTFILKRKQKNQ